LFVFSITLLFFTKSEGNKKQKTVFILPHHLDLTLFPFGPKMHCRDKEYYNGQQGKEYQDMKRTKSGAQNASWFIRQSKSKTSTQKKKANLTSNANQHVTLLKA